MEDVTRKAIEAIGPDQPVDWELRPEQHADLIVDKVAAGPLIRILNLPDLEPIVDAYTVADSKAINAQTWFKRLAKMATYASFATIVIAALLLLPRPAGQDFLAGFITWGAALQFSLLATSFLVSIWLGAKQPYKNWMEYRAEAEMARQDLFRHVMTARTDVRPNELPLLPLKVEYFRRFHLDIQRFYFDRRGREHRAAVRRRMFWRIVAVVLIFLASGSVLLNVQSMKFLSDGVTQPIWHFSSITTWIRPSDCFYVSASLGVRCKGF